MVGCGPRLGLRSLSLSLSRLLLLGWRVSGDVRGRRAVAPLSLSLARSLARGGHRLPGHNVGGRTAATDQKNPAYAGPEDLSAGLAVGPRALDLSTSQFLLLSLSLCL
jgi:hypothetical protein